jgi:hypothetical protein
VYQKQHKTTVEILQSAGGGAHRFRLRRSGHFLGVVSQGRQQGRAAGVAPAFSVSVVSGKTWFASDRLPTISHRIHVWYIC